MSETRLGTWRQLELELEPMECHRILKEFWDKRVIERNQDSVEALRDMLDRNYHASLSIFDEAIAEKNLEKFLKLTNVVPSHAIRSIDGFENLGVIAKGLAETKLDVEMDAEDHKALQAYADEKNISASIAISIDADKQGEIQKITTGNEKQLDIDAPSSIYSVGKVFTGILALIMIREGILTTQDLNSNLFDQLDDSVKKILPSTVAGHLKKVTLHQAMTHRAGLGNQNSNADYLGRYGKAISAAVEKNAEAPDLPKIEKVEDFIPFAFPQNEAFKPGTPGRKDYSNAGILLVGLAIENAYKKFRDKQSEKKLKPLDFNGLMKKYVLDKAFMSGLSPERPVNAKFNADDKIDHQVTGGPAGGYWTTVEDLAKFGKWLYRKCSSDRQFKSLIEKYGEEFYRDGVISHKGDVRSGSSYLSVSLRTGRVVAVLNSQRDNAAAEMGYAIKRNLFSELKNNVKQKFVPLSQTSTRFFSAQETKGKENSENKFTDEEMKSAFAQGSNTAKVIARKKR